MMPSTSTGAGTSARFHPVSSLDFVPREQLRLLQSDRLQSVVRRAYENVPFYRRQMLQRGLTPETIRGLDDLSRLGFTVKTDLRDAYPLGLLACPMREVVRMHASSGTTGKPVVVAYTQGDLGVWTNVIMRSRASFGLHEGDVIQNAYDYGLFTDGLGLHYGAEALGATVIPTSSGDTDRQILLMRDLGVSAVCCTPSYFLHLLDRAAEMGVDLRGLPLRAGIFGGEPWTEDVRTRIQDTAGLRAYDLYGLIEIIGPGVGAECSAQQGLHLFEDHFYPEIIDPGTGQPLPDGSVGELVLTTLSKQAMPMLRYRTRDITSIAVEPCPCGRTLRRIRRVSHRNDDMFIVRGVNVFPSQIESALLEVRQPLPRYRIVLTRQQGLDQVEVQIEVTPEVFSDRLSVMEDLETRIAQQIEHTIGLRVAVRLIEPHALAPSEDKARRVIDKREL